MRVNLIITEGIRSRNGDSLRGQQPELQNSTAY
jgi:hypothetical protein